MELQPIVRENNVDFKWNASEIKAELASQLEKYTDLVVTEGNYKDMKKAQAEIVKFRTTITKFGQECKRELKKPVDVFTSELNDVLTEVSRVEQPLKQQLDYFDGKEREEKQATIDTYISELQKDYALRDEYVAEISHDPRWLNKTFKLSEVQGELNKIIKSLSEQQQANDDYIQILEEKKGMISFVVDTCNAQYELATPIEFEDVWKTVQAMPLDQAKEVISSVFEQRREVEEKALALAAKEAETNKIEQHIEVKEEPITNDITGNFQFTLYNVTPKDVEEVRTFMTVRGIDFKGELI